MTFTSRLHKVSHAVFTEGRGCGGEMREWQTAKPIRTQKKPQTQYEVVGHVSVAHCRKVVNEWETLQSDATSG